MNFENVHKIFKIGGVKCLKKIVKKTFKLDFWRKGWRMKEIVFTWLLDIDRRGHPFSVCEKNVDCKGQVYFLNYDVKFKIVCKF